MSSEIAEVELMAEYAMLTALEALEIARSRRGGGHSLPTHAHADYVQKSGDTMTGPLIVTNPYITLFGSEVATAVDTWESVGFTDLTSVATPIRLDIANGQTFTLYALGQLNCSNSANANIQVTKGGVITTVKALGLGVKYATYSSSNTVAGPDEIYLLGLTHANINDRVGGFMVYTIT